MPTEDRLKKLRQVARQRQSGLTVVIEDVFDPHNLGAIARSCDAFGVQEIHIIFETHPPFDPKSVGKNSSTATNKWLRFHAHHGTGPALSALKGDGWLIVAAALDPAAESIYQADLGDERIALLLGNEKTGLSAAALAGADRRVTIPMRGIAQSMNVSVSAALLLYEVTRQRHARGLGGFLQDDAGAQRTLAYLLEMHDSHSKRNKRLRKQRAKARGKSSTKGADVEPTK